MLEFKTKKYSCSILNESSILPDLSVKEQGSKLKSTIDDFEGLFISYGARATSYPYRQQNDYTDKVMQEVNVAILENEKLYAEFLIDFGGRLWKLYDKDNKKDILYTNDVIRLRNLSIRNAWFSGGAEWNCGIIGHSPFTCQRMYCAKVKGKNGEDVLRFYEFERTRSIYYQIDFWLNNNCLLSRVHIVNPNAEVVPMYWWSNIATPEYKGGRVAVNADSAYNNSDGLGIKKSKIPFDGGIDASYPENIPDTIDYFYDIPQTSNKFIANVNSDGFGLLQFSSNRLKGRKLFSWGHRSGSANWQERLTDKAGWYVEIQAGLGKTQYECLPMPPKTSWDFIECYTLADIKSDAVNKPYNDFTACVNSQINSLYSSDMLDELCNKTLDTIAMQKGEIVHNGSGYGYLFEQLGGKRPEHLEFLPSEDIDMFLEIQGEKANKNSVDFAFGDVQEKHLLSLTAKNDWRIFYQLSLINYDRHDFVRAKEYAQKAFLLDNNLFLNHLYACILFIENDQSYIYFAKKALASKRDNYGVCEKILSLFIEGEAYFELIDCFEMLDESVKNKDRIKMYLSFAYLKTGEYKKAHKLLWGNGGLYIEDYREGEKFLDSLYRELEHKLTGKRKKDITVPKQFDFIVAKQVDENE